MKIKFNISIKTKLLIMAAAGIIPLMTMGIAMYFINRSMEEKTRTISTIILPRITNIGNILHNLERLRIIEYKYCLSGDVKEKAFYEKEMKSCIDEVNWNMKVIPGFFTEKREKSTSQNFSSDYREYIDIHQKILIHSASGRYDSMRLLLTTISRTLFTRQVTQLQQLSGFSKLKLRYTSDQIHTEVLSVNFIFAIITPLLISLLVFLYFNLSVSLFRTISKTDKTARY